MQRQFSLISNAFDYVDELFFIFIAIKIAAVLITKHGVFKRRDQYFFGLCVILVIVGLLGNIRSNILNKPFYIAVDIISTFKVLLSYYYIKTLRLTLQDCDKTIRLLAVFTRILIVIIAICYMLSILGFIPDMLDDPRYGIPSYRFTFNVAGNYSKFFYFVIPILSADLFYFRQKRKWKYIVLGLFMWCTSLRSRAFAFAACYIIFAFRFFKMRKSGKRKLNLLNMIPIILLAIIIGWDQIIFYLINDTQARANLLRYSFVTAGKYFPLGSGFGTYGSDVAVTNYSKLYNEYGFLNIYGMGFIHTNFLNDNYWPMIIGQFGIIGTIINIMMIYYLYKDSLSATKQNRYFYFATICMFFFLLASGIASKSYCEFTSISVMILHALLAEREKRYTRRMKTWLRS